MSDPYREDEGFGRELGKTLKLVAWCFYDWSDKHPDEIMGAIEFDKLIELVCRFWDALNAAGFSSFGTPFSRYFGVHGSGRALRRNEKPSSDIPENDSDHPLVYGGRVFELFNGVLRGEYLLIKIQDKQGKRTFTTGLTSAQIGFWESDDRFLNRNELGIFTPLRSALAVLTAEEIRLLGTHTSADDNEQTLKKIAGRWIDAILSAFRFSPGTGPDLSRIVKCFFVATRNARELVRKAGGNKAVYTTARRKFLAAVKNTVMEKPAMDLQCDANAIWTGAAIERWRGASRVLFRFSKYAYAAALRALELDGAMLRQGQKRDLIEGGRSRARLAAQLSSQSAGSLPRLAGAVSGDPLPTVDEVAAAIVAGTGMTWLHDLQEHLCRDLKALFVRPDA